MARHIHIHLTRDAARMDANGVRSMTAGQINAREDVIDPSNVLSASAGRLAREYREAYRHHFNVLVPGYEKGIVGRAELESSATQLKRLRAAFKIQKESS